MVDVEKEYASKGVAGAGLGTGIAGLSLGVLNAMGGLGALALGNRNPAHPMPYGAVGYAGAGVCSENMPVSRYELDREQKLAAKDSEIAMLKANTYNDQKTLEMYAYMSIISARRTASSWSVRMLHPSSLSCPRTSRLRRSAGAAGTTLSLPTQTPRSTPRW